MKQQCIFTGEVFQTNNPDEKLSPNSKKYITDAIKHEPQIKKEVIAAIISDDELLREIAIAVLGVHANDVGLCSSGTIAEFFLRLRRKLARKKTPKVPQKVREGN